MFTNKPIILYIGLHVRRGMVNWLLVTSFMLLGVTTQAALHDKSPPQVKTAEQWSSTGSMSTARERHTATLLPSGKVLVAGGYYYWGYYRYLSSAEVYDPSTGSWSSTAAMSTARQLHTATLLSNGKVLVAGGYNGSSLSSAEIYDPSSGSWSSTGAMSTARYIHTATLLPSGKVLVAGGYNGSSLSSAEIYDPSSGSWSSTGAMSTARYIHTATLLPSGKVLVAGGWNGSAGSSAEVYDPSTGSWSSTGAMSTARENHTATLLPSGKVLVAGGVGSSTVSSAEVYDPSTGSWSSTGSMSTARYVHTATLLPSGKVLVAGGHSGSSGYLSSAEVYDPSTSSWSNTGSMNTGRQLPTATLLSNGKVLVAGGYNSSSGYLSSAELYEPTVALTAPAVSTDAPSLITATNAVLKGTVNPNGAETTASFDFGLTTGYGENIAATPSPISATAGATAVSANKTGLTCGTTYHYRVTAVNSVGSTNGADKSFTTTACPRDLIVTNITLNPAKPVAGTAFSAIVTVKNQGTVATAASKLKLWPNLATVPVCTTAAAKIADIAALAAGASVNITVTGLTSSVVGSNTFRAFADGTCIIGETNEANNQRTLSYRIGGRLPDLIITNITLTPAAPARNAVFNAAITVRNQGTAVSGHSFLDVWTNQATAATCGAVGDTWADIGALAAGASKVINITGLNAGAIAGAKTLRAFVDSWCEEVESNEGNNQLIKAYTVQ